MEIPEGMPKTLFVESLENHQKLIDVLLAHQNEDGICEITEEEILSELKKSSAWLKKAVKKINTEDLCIESIGSTLKEGYVKEKKRYKVHYDNLLTKGIFHTIFCMIYYTSVEDINIIRMKNEELMELFQCPLKTVQMYRAYCTSGWIQGTKNIK